MIIHTLQKNLPTHTAHIDCVLSPGGIFNYTMELRVLIKSSVLTLPDYERVILCVNVPPDSSPGEIII